MSLRLVFAAAIVFVGYAGAASALPSDTFTLPNDQTQTKPKDSTDGLFNHSVSDRWDNSSSSSHSDSDGVGKFHFTVRSESGSDFAPPSSYGDAKTPMSEFYQPTPSTSTRDPLLDPIQP
jgi:hypothetical protein